MSSHIKIFTSENADLTVTTAIERYRSMSERDISCAISDEWPQQMAVILILFIAAASDPTAKHTYKFIHRARKSGQNSYVDIQTKRRRRS
jgi:hypothetical protein